MSTLARLVVLLVLWWCLVVSRTCISEHGCLPMQADARYKPVDAYVFVLISRTRH